MASISLLGFSRGNKSVCKCSQLAILFGLTILAFLCHLVEPKLDINRIEEEEDASVRNAPDEPQADQLQCGFGFNSTSNIATSWRIYGGREAEPGEFPFMVNVFSDEGFHICGGVIIDHRLILSARHCFKDREKDSLQIYVGDYDQDLEADGERRVAIHRIVSHPDADLALLITEEPLEWKITEDGFGSVNRICLPRVDWRDRLGSNVSVAGWGEAEIGVDSAKLRWVDVSIVDCGDDSGEAPEDRDEDEDGGQLCASANNGKDSCMGDSGGPLFAGGSMAALDGRPELIGIVSRGPENCGSGGHASYVNVYNFLQWIQHISQSILDNNSNSLRIAASL